MEHRAWYRRRPLILACALVLVAGVVVGVVKLTDDDDPAAASAPTTGSSAGAAQPDAAPGEPTAEVCDNRTVLDGPASPPSGAVSVSTTQQLDDLTEQNPGGTTFWLAPGVHKLGSGAYSQVIPKDGNVYVGAPGAVIDGGRVNRYAFTGYATGVTIKNLTIRNFGPKATSSDEGVVNHDSATGWTLEHNTISQNAGAGAMVGTRNVLRGNCLSANGQYGFNAYNPRNVSDIRIEDNEIAGNNTDDWERLRPGCGCTGGGKFWMTTKAVVRGNWVHSNKSVGLWADTNNKGFLFEGNYISDNEAEGILYETSYNALIRGNAFVRNGRIKGQNSQGFPTPALYISESGSDERVPGSYNKTFDVTGNVFTDNWSGVVLWENADRFAGSPANTSTGSSTLVNPGVVSAKTCNESTIRTKPYLDDCRWKTKNVKIHGNLFSLDPNKMGSSCAARTGCGFNGLFSNWGTYPSWSPYKEETIQDWITFKQGNEFRGNTYAGPWHFVVRSQGTVGSWASWQGAPYSQDDDSVVKVIPPGGR